MRNAERRKYRNIIIALALLVFLEGIFIVALWVKRPAEKPVPAVPKKPAVRASIAIVIDDWGYNLHNLEALEKIDFPFTAAVLPRLPYSAQIARELHERGHEVILHLPMEPREKISLEKNTLMTSMAAQEVIGIMGQDLDSIAYAKGVSNHMGSRATEDERTMKAVFKELKRRNLYFLDSFVSARSVCAQVASQAGLAFAKRDIFLDNKSDPAYIKGQIQKLKSLARARGSAIGIGHDRVSTFAVLKEVIPQLRKEGYKLVFVSDLTR
ncbi:MAG: divergent polysaccharide deacetylase family protein [Candidatus Omnitrophica bacterium]|nr:divergent polysaccharide deacetylase family protein [Candidatus Omnitrophota bacterium]